MEFYFKYIHIWAIMVELYWWLLNWPLFFATFKYSEIHTILSFILPMVKVGVFIGQNKLKINEIR